MVLVSKSNSAYKHIVFIYISYVNACLYADEVILIFKSYGAYHALSKANMPLCVILTIPSAQNTRNDPASTRVALRAQQLTCLDSTVKHPQPP